MALDLAGKACTFPHDFRIELTVHVSFPAGESLSVRPQLPIMTGRRSSVTVIGSIFLPYAPDARSEHHVTQVLNELSVVRSLLVGSWCLIGNLARRILDARRNR